MEGFFKRPVCEDICMRKPRRKSWNDGSEKTQMLLRKSSELLFLKNYTVGESGGI